MLSSHVSMMTVFFSSHRGLFEVHCVHSLSSFFVIFSSSPRQTDSQSLILFIASFRVPFSSSMLSLPWSLRLSQSSYFRMKYLKKRKGVLWRNGSGFLHLFFHFWPQSLFRISHTNLSYESYEYLEETAGYFNVQFLKEIFQRRQ